MVLNYYRAWGKIPHWRQPKNKEKERNSSHSAVHFFCFYLFFMFCRTRTHFYLSLCLSFRLPLSYSFPSTQILEDTQILLFVYLILEIYLCLRVIFSTLQLMHVKCWTSIIILHWIRPLFSSLRLCQFLTRYIVQCTLNKTHIDTDCATGNGSNS